MSYTRLAIANPAELTDELFGQAREIFPSANHDENVLCHCGSANRVGAVWLAHRVLHEGVAFRESQEVGLRNPAMAAATEEYIKAQTSR